MSTNTEKLPDIKDFHIELLKWLNNLYVMLDDGDVVQPQAVLNNAEGLEQLFLKYQNAVTALQSRVQLLEKQRDQAQLAMAIFWNRSGPHSTWIPTPILQAWLDRAEELEKKAREYDKKA